jgi:hypothetical protein
MNKKQRVRRRAREKRAVIAQARRDAAFVIDIDTPSEHRIIKKDTKKVPLRAAFFIKTHGGGYRKGWQSK